MNMNEGCKLSPVGLGLAVGILCGLSLLVMGLMSHYYGHPYLDAMYTFGYGLTVIGSLVAGLLGLVKGFIMGFLMAWLYNIFACCKCCKK